MHHKIKELVWKPVNWNLTSGLHGTWHRMLRYLHLWTSDPLIEVLLSAGPVSQATNTESGTETTHGFTGRKAVHWVSWILEIHVGIKQKVRKLSVTTSPVHWTLNLPIQWISTWPCSLGMLALEATLLPRAFDWSHPSGQLLEKK